MTIRVAVVSAMLVVLAAWTHARPEAADVASPDFAATVPLAFGEWVGTDAPALPPEIARVLAADQYVHRFYGLRTTDHGQRAANQQRATDGLRIETDIAYYARPQAGATMHSPLNCLPGNGWQIVESRRKPVIAGATATDVRYLVVSRGPHRIAMTYWFQNRGAVVAAEHQQRFQMLRNGLQGRPTDAALVRVMAGDTPEGRATVLTFTRELMTTLTMNFR